MTSSLLGMAGSHPILLAILTLLALAAFAFATSPNLRDAALKITRALPAAASATVTSTAIDTGAATSLASQQGIEYLLTAPALTTTMAPDTRTMTYTIKWSANADLSAPTTYITGAIVQTGAGGVGAALATFRFKLPSTAARYVFFTVTSGASITDSSAVSATLEPLF